MPRVTEKLVARVEATGLHSSSEREMLAKGLQSEARPGSSCSRHLIRVCARAWPLRRTTPTWSSLVGTRLRREDQDLFVATVRELTSPPLVTVTTVAMAMLLTVVRKEHRVVVIARKVEVVAASERYRAVDVVAGMRELLRAVVELFLMKGGESLRVESLAMSDQELNLFVCLG